ncbi:MAG: hypothetical protein SGJ09_13600, partial [Phycisphaerae bacterium]|nr:hypothetical protein [Phycisphaerae bacterium]
CRTSAARVPHECRTRNVAGACNSSWQEITPDFRGTKEVALSLFAMSRPLRLIVPGIPNLVVHGGNNGQHIFRNDADRDAYLRLLNARFRHHHVNVAGFALCAVRSLFVAVPPSATALSHAIQHAHSEYARMFNRARGRRDSLFHARFWSIPVSDSSIAEALAFVEAAPLREKLCANPDRWHWSSAAFHLGATDRPAVLTSSLGTSNRSQAAWRAMIALAAAPAQAEPIERRLQRAIPLGNSRFVARTLATFAPTRQPLRGLLGDVSRGSVPAPVRRRSRGARPAASIA